jgi:catechol 2,3-dioxygenase-like lactoylglutathione lyase family enzyme
MRAKVFFITLAVDDLGRSLAFYRDGLGWPTQGVVGQEFHDELTGADGTIAIFTLDDGLTLMLYERANLAKDASLPAGPPSSTEFSLGIPAESREEVDRLLTQAQAADGTVTAPAHMRPFGVYSGYFMTSTGTSSRSPGTPASSAAYPPRAWPPQHRIPPGRYPR